MLLNIPRNIQNCKFPSLFIIEDMDDLAQTTTFPRTDHDLLIEVSANVKNLNTTLIAYTDAATKTTQDHEMRIRTLEADNQSLKGSQRTVKTLLAVVSVVATVAGVVVGILAFK
jgi:hypothetical protein